MVDTLRIKRRALGGAAGAPASLAVGELAFNEVDGGLYIGRSDGSVLRINTTGGVLVSDAVPASPTSGQLWWESDTGVLWIYYDDGTSQQWIGLPGSASSGGTGGIAEAPTDGQTYGRQSASWVALGGSFTTGDVKLTLKTSADAGWVMMNDGSIGDASSGATYANANAQALFVLLWSNISDTWCPVSGGRGANGLSDFNAHKKLTLPRTLGRALAAAGAGSGLTSRTLGGYLGEESHTQSGAELAAHAHGTADSHYHNIPANSHVHNHDHYHGGYTGATYPVYAGYTPVDNNLDASAVNVHYADGQYSNSVVVQYLSAVGGIATDASQINTPNTYGATNPLTVSVNGSSSPANVMQPTSFLNVMIKL